MIQTKELRQFGHKTFLRLQSLENPGNMTAVIVREVVLSLVPLGVFVSSVCLRIAAFHQFLLGVLFG